MNQAEPTTKQACLNAALELWGEKGYANSTMRELARRLKMGLSALYAIFPTREHIVLALYEALSVRVVEQFQTIDDGQSDLAVNVKRLLEIKLQLLTPHRAAMAALFREAVDPDSSLSPLSSDSSSVRERMAGLFKVFALRAGVEIDQAEQAGKAIWLGHLAIVAYWLHDRSPAAEHTQRLIEKASAGATFLPMLLAAPEFGEVLGLFAKLVPAEETPTDKPAPVALPDNGRECDVVVIGGGPIGVVYASWLKLARPETSVTILERDLQPGHKIGESTLSGLCKALRNIGIPHEAMQRLFFPKNGLGFFYADETTRDLTKSPEYILETFDETFQVERRPLENLLIMNARRLGVQVIQGATVEIERSQTSAQGNEVAYRIGDREFRIACRLLVDASGPTGVLGRQVGDYTDAGLPFQTSAVWGYFRNVRRLQNYRWPRKAQFSRDEYTQHICFREGWLWYIPIVSWEASPDANLQRLLEQTLDTSNPLPQREELIREFGCPTCDITSIGLVLRNDRDDRLRDDPRAAFEHYRRKYQAIDQLLKDAELLEDHYGSGRPYSSRTSFRRYARQVTGDGWLLVGDAAFFVDPLISPGLTGGVASAYEAVQDTLAAFDSGIFSRDSFSRYEAYVRKLHDALERDNQLVYMSFNHPEAMALLQRFQEIDARRHFNRYETAEYAAEDTNVWGILDAEYQLIQKDLHRLMREHEQAVGVDVPIHEQSARDYEIMVGRMRERLQEYLEDNLELNPFIEQNAEA